MKTAKIIFIATVSILSILLLMDYSFGTKTEIHGTLIEITSEFNSDAVQEYSIAHIKVDNEIVQINVLDSFSNHNSINSTITLVEHKSYTGIFNRLTIK